MYVKVGRLMYGQLPYKGSEITKRLTEIRKELH